MTTYRYTLQRWTGKDSRLTCPACEQPAELVPYVDTENNELLPERFGRCNREDKCGYKFSPYDKGATGQSYADEIRQNAAPSTLAWSRRAAILAPPPIGIIPDQIVQQSLGHYAQNNFARLLQRRFGAGQADELLQRFEIGTSSYWPGAHIFWQRDELGRVRGGQVALFNQEDGHTVRRQLPDGKTHRCLTWIHKALEKSCQRRGEPLPDWLITYSKPEIAKTPCLYGLKQLETAPTGRQVAITEAAKTAVLCTPSFPAFIWLAVGSLTNLTAERLKPARNRPITLYPDASSNASAYQAWVAKAAELRRLGFDIQVSDVLETITTEQQKAAGIDLADIILEQWPGYPPSWNEK